MRVKPGRALTHFGISESIASFAGVNEGKARQGIDTFDIGGNGDSSLLLCE